MAQTSILGRVGQLVRANINALLDSAEDPERMLDQLVRDFRNNIAEAEEAVAQTVGQLRLLEDDQREATEAVREWGDKAAAAARKADELRQGNAQEAARFDDLAKIEQTVFVDKLKEGLNKLRAKHDDLVNKRNELVSRAKMASAQRQVQEAVREVSVMDPTSELSRFEERIRQEEAMARGMEEVSRSSIEEEFEALDDDVTEAEVEARLSALRSR
jgi:phage shock protein A